MRDHVRDDELMDAAEGTASTAVRHHVQACPSCRERVADAVSGLGLAQGADVPEPSPLFWDAFRSQVRRRVGSERRWRTVAWLPALAAAAGVAIAIGVLKPAPEAVRPVSTLPAWSAWPVAEDDAGLTQLGALVASDSDALAAVGCRRLADCLSGLSDEETLALAETLSDELATGDDL